MAEEVAQSQDIRTVDEVRTMIQTIMSENYPGAEYDLDVDYGREPRLDVDPSEFERVITVYLEVKSHRFGFVGMFSLTAPLEHIRERVSNRCVK